jgi:sigma-B regulation protein RsbU (phosphoserine phosphatase)
MAAKTAIHGAMEANEDLAEAIGIANRSLCEGNEAEMFVTVFAGVLDYRAGKLTYVNAGHNRPLLMRDGAWSWLTERSGPYMGSFDWVEYKQFETLLGPGDGLFAYTDGVNEAFNTDDKPYGNTRLEAFLTSHGELHPRQLLRAMRAELAGWSYGAEQSDDITMLALRYGIPPEWEASLTTTARLENFGEIEDFTRQHLKETGCPSKAANKLLIAVEELVVNVCSYAYPDATDDEPGALRIHFTSRSNPDAVVIEVCDDGVPFNPLEQGEPGHPGSLEEAKVGGLGLVMTRKLMDEVEYAREGMTNVTAITKRWE